jgi:glycosyltransferase involved in cell wall biosynthesis
MRSNVPVIISKQSGVAEVLDYAIKIDFWDIDAMADAIYALLHFNALPEMFKKYGKTEVENIKWDQAGKKVKDIYQDLQK